MEFIQAIPSTFAIDSAQLYEPEMVIRICLQVFLLLGSAFFSSSETALFSLSQLDLQKLRRERHPRTNTLYQLLEQPRRLIISILCGNEFINVAAAANMAVILATLYGPDNAEWINVVFMVPLLLLFGEITPKTIAVSNPVRYSTTLVAVPLRIWVWLITPLREVIRVIADWVTTWLVGAEKKPENLLRVDEFRTLVEEAQEEGGITPTERTLVYNLIAAGTTEIVEIMTPRTRVQYVDADAPMHEIIESIRQYRHKRLPVFRGNRDNFIGFLRAEDFVPLMTAKVDLTQLKLEDFMQPPIIAPPTKQVDEMFDFFQVNKTEAAMVVNEFGGVDGLVTMSSVLRFIFGNTAGEFSGQHLYRERDDNTYELPGDMKLPDFNRLTHFGIEDPRMTTIGGVVYRHLDRLPREGDRVTVEGIGMTVLSMDRNRIAMLKVEQSDKGAAQDQAPDETQGGIAAGTAELQEPGLPEQDQVREREQ